MTEYISQSHLKGDADQLFAWLSDIGNLPAYIPKMTSARALNSEDVLLSAWVDTPDGPRHTETRAHFAVHEADRRIAWSSPSGSQNYRGEISIRSEPLGSLIQISLSTDRVVGLDIQQELAETLERVRALAEAGQTSVGSWGSGRI